MKARPAGARRMLEDMFVMLKKGEAFRYASPPEVADVTSSRQAGPVLA